MRKAILFLLFSAALNAQHSVWRYIFRVSTLPNAAAYSGQVLLVADGANATDCTVGGGSTIVGCKSNGTAWVNQPISGSGGSGVVLQTNGTNNSVQSTLNLVNGSNITLTNSGSSVTVACTGCSGGGGGASNISQLTDYQPGTIAAGAAPIQPGTVTVSGARCTSTSNASLGISSGSGSETVYLSMSPTCSMTLTYGTASLNNYTLTTPTGLAASTLTGVAGTPAVPAGNESLATCVVTSGTISSCSSARDIWAGWPFLPTGQGVNVAQNTSGNYYTYVSETVRAVTVAQDSVVSGDVGHLITYSAGSSNVAVNWPQAGLGGFFPSGAWVDVTNYGTGTVTLTPNSGHIAGQTSFVLAAAPATYPFSHSCHFVSDGTNWQVGTCN